MTTTLDLWEQRLNEKKYKMGQFVKKLRKKKPDLVLLKVETLEDQIGVYWTNKVFHPYEMYIVQCMKQGTHFSFCCFEFEVNIKHPEVEKQLFQVYKKQKWTDIRIYWK